jgi:SAM-dependent methyltransferase
MNPSPPVTTHVRSANASAECDPFRGTAADRRSAGRVAAGAPATIAAVEADEYRRMAAAGDKHWWYDSTRHLLRQLLQPYLDAVVAHRDDGLALDAGGGTGATGAWMSEQVTTVVADYETLALDVVRADHAAALRGVRTVRADLNHLPFADDSFDIVLCVTALCHRMNPDPAAIVRDFARITRPGGVVCLMEPGVKRLWRGHDEVTHTARRFSVGDLRAMTVAAGLQIERATGAYSFLVPPAAMMQLVERGAPKSDVGRNESGLGGALAVLARAERRLLRRVDLPAGLSALALARKPVSGP